jgi:glutamyl-tRNA reductase
MQRHLLSRPPELEKLEALVLTYREASVDAVASLEGRADEAYETLTPLADGVVVLATCNRFEVYADNVRDRDRFLRELEGLTNGLSRRARLLHGLEAVKHLFRVAAGLDSVIVGDNEVLGQVRKAWLYAREKGYTTQLLDLVFHQALLAGKRVREETGLSRGNVGYPSAAVALAASRLGGLDGRKVLVVGAGKASRVMLSLVCGKWAPRTVVIANRTAERGLEASIRYCGGLADAIPLDALAGLRSFDVAFVAVASGFEEASVIPQLADLVIDISTPRVVYGRNVLDHNDVARYALKALEGRRAEVSRAEAIVEEEVEKLVKRLRLKRADAAIAAVMNYVQSVVDSESREAIARLRGGAKPEEVVPAALYSLAKRVLHPLFQALREASLLDLTALLDIVEQAYTSRSHRR